MFNSGQQIVDQEEFRKQNLPEEQKKEVDAQESAQFGKNVQQMMGMLVNGLSQNNAKNNVTSYNMHEQAGRTGLVEPQLTQQQTNLPTIRRMEQAANFQAIANSLPMGMQQANQQIIHAVNTSVPQMQRQLRQKDSIYAPGGSAGFITNRLNIELQNRRLKSIYAVI